MRFRSGTSRVVDALSAASLHLDRFTHGPDSGEMCCRPGPALPGANGIPADEDDPADPQPLRDPHSNEVATQLLESLLDAEQLASYRADGLFWVDTPRGRVRLGRIYDLRHVTLTGTERSLCVVPDTFERLPDGDVWATLLLWLNADPDEFFRVAIQNPHVPPAEPPPHRARPPGDGISGLLDAELSRMERLYASGAGHTGAIGTGLPAIDAALAGVGAGQVALVVGAPGWATSVFALGTAATTAIRAGHRHEAGDPLREQVVLRAPRACPAETTRALLARDAMVRREDLDHPVLTDDEWRRIPGAVGRLVDMPLHLDVGGSDGAPAAADPDSPTRLVVVDDPTAFGEDSAAVLGDLQALARDRETAVVATTSAARPTDLPAAVTGHTDAIIAIGDPWAMRGRPGSGLTPVTVSVRGSRLGPPARCRAVLVNGWGRFLPVVPPR